MSRLVLAGAIAALLCAAAHADEASYADIPVIAELDRIVVTATLNERAIKDVASDVSVMLRGASGSPDVASPGSDERNWRAE